MDVRITKKGNVVVDGVKYKAIPAPRNAGSVCAHCAFDELREACDPAPCTSTRRSLAGYALHRQGVIFVRKGTL